MKDALGKDLQIGDFVVTMFDDYKTLEVCKVVKFTPKMIGVQLVPRKNTAPTTKYWGSKLQLRYKSSDQVAQVLPTIALLDLAKSLENK